MKTFLTATLERLPQTRARAGVDLRRTGGWR
jgi:hypothetical protein